MRQGGPKLNEWVVAACYPDGRSYPWFNDFDYNKAKVVYGGKQICQTVAVGLFPQSANPVLTLHDLTGSIWKWYRNIYEKPEEEKVKGHLKQSRFELQARFNRLGLPLRLGPATPAEGWAEYDALTGPA